VKRKAVIWTAVGLAVIVAAPIEAFVIGRIAGYCRLMYVSAESMEPTLKAGDRFMAWTRPPSDIERGDIVLVEAPGGSWYIQRVAALPGDRIAMLGGAVLLNGNFVRQQRLGRERTVSGEPVERLREQFPGERSAHEIYNSGNFAFDNVPEQVVAEGHIFLLGDNRDRSADSRVPTDMQGLEQVALSNVRGTPWFFTWTAEGGKWGRRADH
jgi:signal peptidase I